MQSVQWGGTVHQRKLEQYSEQAVATATVNEKQF